MKTFAVKQQEQVAQRPVFSGEEFKDTKGVIRIRKSKKDRQHNGQKEKDKQRSTNYTHVWLNF